MTVLSLLLLIPTFAILDRWCGGGLGWRSTFRGRPIYYVALLIPVAFFLNMQLGFVLLGWCLWRWPAWKLFGGSLAPITVKETSGTILRHCIIFPTIFVCIGSPLIAWACAFVLLIGWVLAASYLACYNGLSAKNGEDVNGKVELIRGLCFGIVSFAVLYLMGVV
jgi:hypothetical protein